MPAKQTPFVARRTSGALLIASLLATGCGLAPMQQADRRIESVTTLADRMRLVNQQQAASSAVVRTHRPRLAGEEVAVRPVDPLPAVLARPLSYSTPGTQTLAEVVLAVSELLGLRILAGEISQPVAPASSGAPQPVNLSGALTGKVKLEFVNRPATALLDEIAAQNDASWRYVARTRTIEFFRFETRTMSVYLPPGAKNVSASISLANVGGGSSSGTSGGGASGGDVSVSQTLLIDPWSSIMGGIAALLSDGQGSNDAVSGSVAAARPTAGAGSGTTAHTGNGLSTSGRAGRATANPELGIVTVTARPAAVERIASYLQSINARFAQNVMVDVKIYSLALDDRAAFGFSLDAVYRRLGHYAVSLVGPAPGQIGSTPGQLTIASERGRFTGSELIVQALSQFGNVALQTQGQVIAINGQPSPIQVANEVNYLASSATTTAANVGTTTTLQPGTRVVGFTANFLPLILGDNRILLQYQMQISQLTALTQVLSGNASIQTPQISSQSLQQQAFVQDGQSIVLFGFDQHRDTTERSLGLGGASKTGTAQRQMIVIVLQVNGGRKQDA